MYFYIAGFLSTVKNIKNNDNFENMKEDEKH